MATVLPCSAIACCLYDRLSSRSLQEKQPCGEVEYLEFQ